MVSLSLFFVYPRPASKNKTGTVVLKAACPRILVYWYTPTRTLLQPIQRLGVSKLVDNWRRFSSLLWMVCRIPFWGFPIFGSEYLDASFLCYNRGGLPPSPISGSHQSREYLEAFFSGGSCTDSGREMFTPFLPVLSESHKTVGKIPTDPLKDGDRGKFQTIPMPPAKREIFVKKNSR